MMKTYTGSCHCGEVRFECDLDLAAGTRKCNCTFCYKTRFWKAFARGNTFRLLQGEEFLSDYRGPDSLWPEGNVHHYFCSRCGVRPFSRGYLEEFGGWFHCVNVACFDNATDEELAAAPVQYEDGKHDNWNLAPAETRHL